MHAAVQAIAAENVASIIRIAAPENWMVKRALDTGGAFTRIPLRGLALTAASDSSWHSLPYDEQRRGREASSFVREIPFS